MTIADAAPTDPLLLLWRIARMWLADAVHALGPLAEFVQLARRTRRAAKRKLRALETLAMKLLLVEAGRVKPTPDRRHLAGSASSANEPTPDRRRLAGNATGEKPMPAGSRRSEDPATPETWRVRFDLRIPPEPSQRRPAINSGPRIRDLGPPVLVPQVFANMAARARIRQLAAARFAASDPERERAKAMKLARRFEALRRALANPFPYARRLARKLHALARRAYAAAIRIARQIIPRWLGNPVVAQQADFQAWRAIHAFPDSS